MDRIEQTSLGFLLLDAARVLRRRFERESRDIPMTTAQLQIVARLKRPRRHDPGRARVAARHRADDAEPPPRPHGGRRPRRAPRLTRTTAAPAGSSSPTRPARWSSRCAPAPLAVYEEAQAGLSPEAARGAGRRPRHHHRQPLRGRRGRRRDPSAAPQEPDHDRRARSPRRASSTGADVAGRRSPPARKRGRRRLLIVALPLALALGGGYALGDRRPLHRDRGRLRPAEPRQRRAAGQRPDRRGRGRREPDRRRRPDALHPRRRHLPQRGRGGRRPASPRPGSRSSA